MLPDVEIGFTFEGEDHTVAFRKVPLGLWSQLKKQTGLTPRAVAQSIEQVDPEGLIALVWLSHQVKGGTSSYRQLFDAATSESEFEIVRLRSANDWYIGEPDDEDDAPDPTAAS